MMITKEQLQAAIKYNPNILDWYDELEKLLPRYNIDTPLRIAAFLAQCSHESMNFKYKAENLNYSSTALNKYFRKYFVGKDVNQYARNPEKIANLVYANRMGNGDEASGDGWKYRGRGIIQLTGKYNYTRFADYLGEPLVDKIIPYLESNYGALESACWYWKEHDLNTYADMADMKELTRRINGGYNGLKDRISHYNHILEVLGVDITEAVDVPSRVLRKGDRGADVAKLQKALNISPVDGDFGPGTERAVKLFQQINGLTVDGIVGKATASKIFD